MNDPLLSIVARHNVERIYGEKKATPNLPVPFVLEDTEPEPLSFLIVRESVVPEPIISGGLLYPGTVMVIGGASKARKSWLAIDLALSLVSGKKFLTHDVPKKIRVLYLGAEGMEWKIKRDFLQAVNFKPGIADEDLDRLWVLPTLGRIKIDTDAGEAWLDKWAGMFHIVIIDPYYRFLSRGKENDHSDQRAIQDAIDRLKAKGKAIILCHHLRKPTGGEDAGAAELRGAGLDQFADSILILHRKRGATSDRTSLTYTLRNAPEPDPLELTISDATGPLLIPAGPVERIVTVADVESVLRESGGRIEGRQPIIEALRRLTGASDMSTRRAIQDAETKGIIGTAKRVGQGQGRTYFLREDRA